MMVLVAGLLTIFIHLPIWFYLLYKILEAIDANELMWFLFWIYVPLGIFLQILVRLIDYAEKKKVKS